jgi:hypothetical protein
MIEELAAADEAAKALRGALEDAMARADQMAFIALQDAWKQASALADRVARLRRAEEARS